MSDSAATIVLVCPKCRAKWKLAAGAKSTSLRCGRCGIALPSNHPPTPAAPTSDDLELAPIPFEPPPKPRIRPDVDDGEEYKLAPAPSPPPPQPTPAQAPLQRAPAASPRSPTKQKQQSQPAPASPPSHLDEDDKNAEFLARPPRGAGIVWAFTSNIFTFPWTRVAVAQWIFASLGLLIVAELALLAIGGFMSGGPFGGVQAGCFGVGGLFVAILTLSYLAGCLLDIVTNAAYNIDKAHDWPDADWGNRIFLLVRMLFLLAIVALPAAGIGWLGSLSDPRGWLLAGPAVFLIFPVLFLSSLEADSLIAPISKPILRSLLFLGHAWIIFYIVTGLLAAAVGYLAWDLFLQSPFTMPLVGAPAAAAAVFVYARLLGRLAWLILHRSENAKDRSNTPRSRQGDADRLREQARWDM
jgi:hypothetical protein